LIQHQIEYLQSLGIRRVFIVIGHLGNEIALALGRGESLGVQIEYVEQQHSLGIAHALMQLEERISGPFILLLGDVYFETDTDVNPIELMHQANASGLLSVAKETRREAIRRNFAVHMDNDGVVHRVIEKPRFSKTEWKGTGLYLFDATIFDAIRRTPRTAGRNEYELTDSIQIFIEYGAKIIAHPTLTTDINLTFPYDLLLSNLHALRRQRLDNLIADDSVINPATSCQECIIGPRVRIKSPVAMYRCVILSDTEITTEEPLDRVIMTPEQLVDCRHWIDGNGSVIAPTG